MIPTRWDAEMRLIERDLDDHLTDDEVAERFDALDRMAQRSSDALVIADPLGVAGTEAVIRHGYGRAALGLIGIVATVLGAAAVIYGARGEETTSAILDKGHIFAPSSLVIHGGASTSGALMTFHPDGTIDVSSDAKPDEAAKAVIDAMRQYWLAMMQPCR
jgi:hypothetical protein